MPIHQINRTFNHKYDDTKEYQEMLYKLGEFAPKPRKAAVAQGP